MKNLSKIFALVVFVLAGLSFSGKSQAACEAPALFQPENSINMECYKAKSEKCLAQCAQCDSQKENCGEKNLECFKAAYNDCGYPVKVEVVVPAEEEPKNPDPPADPQPQDPPPSNNTPNPPSEMLVLEGGGRACSMSLNGGIRGELSFYGMAILLPFIRRILKNR